MGDVRKKFRVFFLLAGLLFLIFSARAVWFRFYAQQKSNQEEKLSVLRYEEKLFRESVARAKINPVQNQVIAGVLPHDYISAQALIANFFASISRVDQVGETRSVLILGPNHDEVGSSSFITTEKTWQTAIGDVRPDLALLVHLRDAVEISNDDQTLQKDHAVSSSVPYVAQYLPDIKIVTILVSGYTSRDELEKFADVIPADTLVIVATDFSHYLRASDTIQMDAESLRAMHEKNVDTVLTYGNEHVDSPNSLAIALMFVKKHAPGAKFSLFDHTNTGELVQSPYVLSTSYMSGVWD